MKNYIIIKNILRNDVELVLENLIYEYDGYAKYESLKLIEIDSANSVFAVMFQHQPDFEHFSYVLNFLKYPIDVDYQDADIKGYYSLSEDLPVLNLKQERLLIYIPNDDTEFFNVSVISESNISFSSNWNSAEHTFDEVSPHFQFSEYDWDINNSKVINTYKFSDDIQEKTGCLGIVMIFTLGISGLYYL